MKGNKMRPKCAELSLLIVAIGLLLIAATARGQVKETPTVDSDSDSTNAATNPTTPKVTLQIWDNWLPRASGAGGRGGNTALSRNVIPVKMFGVMNLIHVEQPVITNATAPGGTQTGAGGTTLYNFSAFKAGGITYGAGPLVVLPTESNTNFGPEKWQAGLAGLLVASPKWGLLGGIFTYQHAFGRGAGPITQQWALQQYFHYNLRSGMFLQSEGATVINSGRGPRAVPVGLGIGRVWKYGPGGTLSAFIEPQYSVWRRGAGAPTWQLFSGISVQIPVAFRLWSK
jgi:hypothetical protein